MPILKNARHEAFAQAVASGELDLTKAFRRITGKKRSGDSVQANRLLKLVKQRVDEIRQSVEKSNHLTMTERRDRLARYVRADPSSLDLTKDGDLLQEYTVISGKEGTTIKFKLPGKRECILADAQLAGDLIEKMEVAADRRIIPRDRRRELVAASLKRRGLGQ